jgi:hypothetical protein
MGRQQMGRELLAAFLLDGVIRGVEPDGTVYRHRVSHDLVQRFLAGLKSGPVAAC